MAVVKYASNAPIGWQSGRSTSDWFTYIQHISTNSILSYTGKKPSMRAKYIVFDLHKAATLSPYIYLIFSSRKLFHLPSVMNLEKSVTYA